MPAGVPATACFGRIASHRFLIASLIVVSLAGCSLDEPVVVERVPKDTAASPLSAEPAAPVAKTDRMLAAIIPRDDSAVFFKLTGPKDRVAAEQESFLHVVESLKFEGDEPQWTLPEGWTERPGSGERIATLTVSEDPPLEVSVTSLPFREGDDLEQYRLANVIRWRRQMGLGPITPDELHAGGDLDDESVALTLSDGTKATLVNLVGRLETGTMPPFAGGFAPPATRQDPAPSQSGGLSYDVPAGWKAIGADGISQATFLAGDSRVTVTPLPSSNTLFANVIRWREQVGLPPIDEERLDETVESIGLRDGGAGDYVQLVGPEEPRQAILGVFTIHDDTAWFVKMVGDAETVLREKSNFETFVKSLRFPGGTN